MYGDSSGLANAANLGIIAAGCGVAFYAVLWVGLLVRTFFASFNIAPHSGVGA
jgi:hypothetical protein